LRLPATLRSYTLTLDYELSLTLGLAVSGQLARQVAVDLIVTGAASAWCKLLGGPQTVQRDLDVPAPFGGPVPDGRPGHPDAPQPGLRGRRRAPRSRGRHSAGRPRLAAITRVIAVGLLAGLGFTVIVFQYQVRHYEAEGVAAACNLITPTAAQPGAPVVRFGLGTQDAFGLVIASDYSSALLIAPLCGLGMILIAPGQRQVRRAGKSLVAASAVMIAWNLVRIGVIALAIRMDGVETGYQVSNLVLGTVVSVACIALSLALLLLMLRPHDGQASTRA
jgi:hypothetical protein